MVLGRSLERLQEGSGGYPSPDAASDTKDVRRWNVTIESGDVAE